MRRRNLIFNEDGVTILEFSLVAPFLFIAVVGIIEIGLVYSAQNVLESAAYVASRTGKTGFVDENKTQIETIEELLKKQAGMLMNPDNIVITKLSYGDFDEIGQAESFVDANGNNEYDEGETFTDLDDDSQWDSDIGQDDYGQGGEVVVYTITYPWTVFTPLIGGIIGNNGTINLASFAVVKNEPY